MVKKSSHMKKKAGQAPGMLVHVGEKKVETVKITVIDYDENGYREIPISSPSQCEPFLSSPTISWFNIQGLHDTSLIEEISLQYNLDPLIMEDILNTYQRPKCEILDSYIYVVMKVINYNDEKQTVEFEQISLILNQKTVLCFMENSGDMFGSIRNRIKNSRWRTRKYGADYLFYALIDSVIDHYFLMLEKLGEKLEELQELATIEPSDEILGRIYGMRKEVILIRRSVWPLRELFRNLQDDDLLLISDQTRTYMKDVYDHVIQIIDTVEMYRDLSSSLMDIYLTMVSNKMNSVMKVLTIISTIFIPLTFLAGIYGMNFEYMPELKWRWAYSAVWGIMITMGVVMLAYFKKKRWL